MTAADPCEARCDASQLRVRGGGYHWDDRGDEGEGGVRRGYGLEWGSLTGAILVRRLGRGPLTLVSSWLEGHSVERGGISGVAAPSGPASCESVGVGRLGEWRARRKGKQAEASLPR